ncbi:hypothetical protein [Streptomyces viridochromogenes]|uniref:HNH endonuclease n=1 Tax=Streptomyces viridochromogenes TaxID=1938 RepID=UPI00069F3C70|nr:hypothetical protein [Streptomyces viridochromogenes]KOG09524.1 hypothetical protein ADK36_40620 [Streptomyces viridochromogenes]
MTTEPPSPRDRRHRSSPRHEAIDKELITRLLADTCEIHGAKDDAQAHHIRALAELAPAGRPPSDWARVMLDRRRKAVVTCDACHDRIHEARTAR